MPRSKALGHAGIPSGLFKTSHSSSRHIHLRTDTVATGAERFQRKGTVIAPVSKKLTTPAPLGPAPYNPPARRPRSLKQKGYARTDSQLPSPTRYHFGAADLACKPESSITSPPARARRCVGMEAAHGALLRASGFGVGPQDQMPASHEGDNVVCVCVPVRRSGCAACLQLEAPDARSHMTTYWRQCPVRTKPQRQKDPIDCSVRGDIARPALVAWGAQSHHSRTSGIGARLRI